MVERLICAIMSWLFTICIRCLDGEGSGNLDITAGIKCFPYFGSPYAPVDKVKSICFVETN